MDEMTTYSGYDSLVESIGSLLESARGQIATSVNTILVQTYWNIGKYIVEFEQDGAQRAEYGSNLLNRLSKDLTLRYGKGFGHSNLIYIRKLYLAFPNSGTLSHFLSWSHYYEILKSEDPLEIGFYAKECETQKWSVRELKRQKSTALSSLNSPVCRNSPRGMRKPWRTPLPITSVCLCWSWEKDSLLWVGNTTSPLVAGISMLTWCFITSFSRPTA